MYVFIATIFIAELIIAGTIIFLILKFDKKAQEFNIQASISGKELIKTTKEVKEILITAQGVIENVTSYISKKKNEFRQKLINLAMIYAILVVFKLRFKRAATVFQYALLAKEVWDRVPV